MFYPVHLHKSKIQSSYNVHLLFIPTLIFALIIAVYIFASSDNKTKIAATSEPSVLGKEIELDNSKSILQNKIR